jgi:hypothetical protein
MDTASRPNFGTGPGGDFGRQDLSGARHPFSEKPGQTMGFTSHNPNNYNTNVRSMSDGIKTETSSTEEGIAYPGPFKLFCITLALCLAVFLVALVSKANNEEVKLTCLGSNNHCNRMLCKGLTKHADRPRPFPRSPTSSRHSMTLDGQWTKNDTHTILTNSGMALRTCLRFARSSFCLQSTTPFTL